MGGTLQRAPKVQVGDRPGRCEPRAVKSKPKTFPILRKSRKVEQDKLQKK